MSSGTGYRREHFNELAAEAIDGLPDDILKMLDNVEIVVADTPTAEQLDEAELEDGELLLGLYEGIPLTNRNSNYGLVLPDKITLFQHALESVCPDEEALRNEVRITVIHELAHHFGISKQRLQELGWGDSPMSDSVVDCLDEEGERGMGTQDDEKKNRYGAWEFISPDPESSVRRREDTVNEQILRELRRQNELAERQLRVDEDLRRMKREEMRWQANACVGGSDHSWEPTSSFGILQCSRCGRTLGGRG